MSYTGSICSRLLYAKPNRAVWIALVSVTAFGRIPLPAQESVAADKVKQLTDAIATVQAQLDASQQQLNELRRQLAYLGHKKLDERGAEKRAFNSWLRANNLHNLTLSSEQIARIVEALGSPAPSDRSALVTALNAALDGAR